MKNSARSVTEVNPMDSYSSNRRADSPVSTNAEYQTYSQTPSPALDAHASDGSDKLTSLPADVRLPEIWQAKYRLLSIIGEGSNGITYLAEDILSGGNVAIKKLKQDRDFKSLDLFMRELEVMKSISIKGVPQYIDSYVADGEYYLVQEYIAADSVASILEERGRLPEPTVWLFLLRLASILDALETKYQPPIIHRDIKPSNILSPKNGQYYLIDFGSVAKPERKNLNSTIAGTQGYMAPEQLMGDCTIQSDYYGLGATALHMLTGLAPFEMDVVDFKLQYEKAIDLLAPGTSPFLRDVLAKLLAVKPGDRPANSADLIACIRDGMDLYEGRSVQTSEKFERCKKLGRYLKLHRKLIPFLYVPCWVGLTLFYFPNNVYNAIHTKSKTSKISSSSVLLVLVVVIWFFSNVKFSIAGFANLSYSFWASLFIFALFAGVIWLFVMISRGSRSPIQGKRIENKMHEAWHHIFHYGEVYVDESLQADEMVECEARIWAVERYQARHRVNKNDRYSGTVYEKNREKAQKNASGERCRIYYVLPYKGDYYAGNFEITFEADERLVSKKIDMSLIEFMLEQYANEQLLIGTKLNVMFSPSNGYSTPSDAQPNDVAKWLAVANRARFTDGHGIYASTGDGMGGGFGMGGSEDINNVLSFLNGIRTTLPRRNRFL